MKFKTLLLIMFLSITSTILLQGCSSTSLFNMRYIGNKDIKEASKIKNYKSISPIQLAKKVNPELKEVETVFQIGYLEYRGFFNPINLLVRFGSNEKPYNLIGIFKEYCENNEGLFIYRPYSFLSGRINILNVEKNVPKNFKKLCERKLKDILSTYELPSGYLKKDMYCYNSLYTDIFKKSIPKEFKYSLDNYTRKIIGSIYGNLKKTYTFACINKQNSFILLGKEEASPSYINEYYMHLYISVDSSIVSKLIQYIEQAKKNITKTLDNYLKEKIAKEVQNKIFGYPLDKNSPIEYVVLNNSSFKPYLVIYVNNKLNEPVVLKLFDKLFFVRDNKTYAILYEVETQNKVIKASTSSNLHLQPDNEILINPDVRGIISIPIRLDSIYFNDLDGAVLTINEYRFLLKKPLKDKN